MFLAFAQSSRVEPEFIMTGRGNAFGKQSPTVTPNLTAECIALGRPGKPTMVVYPVSDKNWVFMRGVWAKHLGDQTPVL
jgi:hypothetical protein